MTVRDFMNYLIYVEHAAENLQFYLWYKDYVQRFESASTADIKLAPEWTQAMQDETVARIRKDNFEKRRAEPEAAAIFKGSDFDHKVASNVYEFKNLQPTGNPFGTPPRTPQGAADRTSVAASMTGPPSTYASTNQTHVSEAFQNAGARIPCVFCLIPLWYTVDNVVRDVANLPFQSRFSLSERKSTE